MLYKNNCTAFFLFDYEVDHIDQLVYSQNYFLNKLPIKVKIGFLFWHRIFFVYVINQIQHKHRSYIMKRLINLAVIVMVLSVFTSSIFAQQEVNTQNRKEVKAQTLQGTNNQGPNWIDADGDGICDNVGTSARNQMKGVNGKGQKGNKKGGFGDGTGARPQDGTGFGSGNGTGVCDETGPKGSARRSGRK